MRPLASVVRSEEADWDPKSLGNLSAEDEVGRVCEVEKVRLDDHFGRSASREGLNLRKSAYLVCALVEVDSNLLVRFSERRGKKVHVSVLDSAAWKRDVPRPGVVHALSSLDKEDFSLGDTLPPHDYSNRGPAFVNLGQRSGAMCSRSLPKRREQIRH